MLIDLTPFGPQPEVIPPYASVGPRVRLCYSKKATQQWAVATARVAQGFDALGKPEEYLVVDGSNFAAAGGDGWFGVELTLPPELPLLDLRLRVYPAERLYPRLYFDGGETYLPEVLAHEQFFHLKYARADLIRNYGLPKDVGDLRITLFVPQSNWFVLGLMESANA